ELQCCGSPRPAEGDLQNGSGRRGPYISVRSCARSFPQRDHRARKGVLRVIADDETSSILAPHASTGMSRFLHSRSAALAPSAVVPLCSQNTGPCRLRDLRGRLGNWLSWVEGV